MDRPCYCGHFVMRFNSVGLFVQKLWPFKNLIYFPYHFCDWNISPDSGFRTSPLITYKGLFSKKSFFRFLDLFRLSDFKTDQL